MTRNDPKAGVADVADEAEAGVVPGVVPAAEAPEAIRDANDRGKIESGRIVHTKGFYDEFQERW